MAGKRDARLIYYSVRRLHGSESNNFGQAQKHRLMSPTRPGTMEVSESPRLRRSLSVSTTKCERPMPETMKTYIEHLRLHHTFER